MAALLVLVLVVVGYWVVHLIALPDRQTNEPTVDYAMVVPPARKAAHFHLVAPVRLPQGWRATSVRFDPGPPQAWHLAVPLQPSHRSPGVFRRVFLPVP